MAGRILNRRELRKQADAAEAAPPETADPASLVKKGAKAKAVAPKVKKPRKKKEPPRQRARWGVFDCGMKQIAIFDYNQRDQANQKVADLTAKKNGIFFLQVVKEAIPEAPPAEMPDKMPVD